MTNHFDLCIIGSGSGNTIVDDRFDGWKVAIVERGVYGGTCLNVGCIPTKMLVYPADLVEDARDAARFGVDLDVGGVRWSDIRDRVFGRIDPISASGLEYRKDLPNVTVFEANAAFVGHKRLRVGAEEITADRFVIAAGARSVVPEISGLAEVPFDTSDTIMRIDEVPEHLVVIGGGFIALELAHVFEAYGATVTVLARGDRVARTEDLEISERITRHFAERLDLRLNTRIHRVEFDPSSPASDAKAGDASSAVGRYRVTVEGNEGTEVIEADRLLVAVGRIPNGDQLEVQRTGVRLDDAGYVITDATMATDADGIWALGDVCNPMQLKHVANHEARVVQHNLLHPEAVERVAEAVVPYGIFTSPQIASVGAKEHELIDAGRPYVAALKEYADTAYGWAMQDTQSCVKVLADPATGRILGAHIIGPDAAVMIQILVMAMSFDLPVEQVARNMMYPHPALSEVVENALLDLCAAMGR
ncbi:MAG: mycothione reductase [Microthrixaceae bacterium]